MAGKTCIVTGATSGIGRVTARELARQGAQVWLVVRDAERGRRTAAEIGAETGNRGVGVVQADLSSVLQVRRAAGELLERCERVDVLLNNAGAMYLQREVTVDGLERTFSTNHLSYFLLTVLLLERLRRTGGARVVSVASAVHQGGRIDFDDLQSERGYGPMKAYAQSKLANVLFTYELARRLAGSGVTANCLHPGVIGSQFGHNNRGVAGLLFKIAGPFMMTPEKGARTSIYLATSPEVAGVSGQYFDRCRPKQSSKGSHDLEVARRLWEVSERLTGLS